MIERNNELKQYKAGAVGSKPAAQNSKLNNHNTPKKCVRVLSALLTGKSFNRFEAETELNDHCLHSTISTLKNKYSVIVSRKSETVRGYQGIPTIVKRYSLDRDEENLKLVRQLLQRVKD